MHTIICRYFLYPPRPSCDGSLCHGRPINQPAKRFPAARDPPIFGWLIALSPVASASLSPREARGITEKDQHNGYRIYKTWIYGSNQRICILQIHFNHGRRKWCARCTKGDGNQSSTIKSLYRTISTQKQIIGSAEGAANFPLHLAFPWKAQQSYPRRGCRIQRHL